MHANSNARRAKKLETLAISSSWASSMSMSSVWVNTLVNGKLLLCWLTRLRTSGASARGSFAVRTSNVEYCPGEGSVHCGSNFTTQVVVFCILNDADNDVTR